MDGAMGPVRVFIEKRCMKDVWRPLAPPVVGLVISSTNCFVFRASSSVSGLEVSDLGFPLPPRPLPSSQAPRRRRDQAVLGRCRPSPWDRALRLPAIIAVRFTLECHSPSRPDDDDHPISRSGARTPVRVLECGGMVLERV